MSATLNGWTAARLDDLAEDVAAIRKDVAEMRSEELHDLKRDLAEARGRPRAQMTAYLAPFLAGLIPALLIILFHNV